MAYTDHTKGFHSSFVELTEVELNINKDNIIILEGISLFYRKETSGKNTPLKSYKSFYFGKNIIYKITTDAMDIQEFSLHKTKRVFIMTIKK